MSAKQQITHTTYEDSQRIAGLKRLVGKLHTRNQAAISILWIVAAIVTIVFIGIIISLLISGFPYLIKPQFYGTHAEFSIGREIFNTFYILVLSQTILIPISLAAAIYLVEYARQGPLVHTVHFAAETLAGVPSIVLGLFGFAIFSTFLGLGTSRLSGALTLLCLNFPIALRLFENALTTVAREQREGGLALGATKWHVIRTVVIPAALPGIVTGIVLTAGKIVGEAAALIFTMGTSNPANVFTLNPLISSDNLTINIYMVQSTGGGFSAAVGQAISSGSAALLIIILLAINIGARYIGQSINRSISAV